MRYSSLLAFFVGAAALLPACASKHRDAEQKEVRTEAEAKKEGTHEEKGIVERVRERMGLGGCKYEVIAHSANAVAEPCRTTAEVMKEQGLTEEQMDQVNRYAAMLEKRGESRQAH